MASQSLIRNIFLWSQSVTKSRKLFLYLCFVCFASLLFFHAQNATLSQILARMDYKALQQKTFYVSDALNDTDFSEAFVTAAYPTPNYEGMDDHQNASDKRNLKTILLWNPFFMKPDYGAGFGTSAFVRTNCPVKCWITNDTEELSTADAVVVHSYNLGSKFQNVTLPARQNQQQIFAFFILESPLKSYPGLTELNFSLVDVFNLTMSYLDHPDTDIRVPIGKIIRNKHLDHSKLPRVRKLQKKRRFKKYVVWFVSNCDVYSARNAYVTELAKYIPVDIYGDCGTYTCPKSENCFREIAKEYYFYLSFENSYCQDYMTEKVYRTLYHRMVPIVLGDGNYRKDLPRKSYIDVRQFTSPRTLAQYLHYLRTNAEEYRKYFLWKTVYSIASEQWSKTVGFCRLCQILHNQTYPYKSNFDPVHYWDPNRWCLRGRDERRAVHLL